MSKRTPKKKPAKTGRSESASRQPADSKASLPVWFYILVVSCLLAGIAGGVYLRHRRTTPLATDQGRSKPEMTIARGAADPKSPPSDSPPPGVPAGESSLATRENEEPAHKPPTDPAERIRIENRFGVLFKRGYENYVAERYAAAADDFQKAVETAPYLAEGHYLLGQVYRKMSLDELAEKSYRASLRQMPDFDPAQKELCELLHEQGAYEQANAILLEMQRRMPDDPFILGEMAINHTALGQPQQAVPLLQKYNQIAGRQGWGYAHLGRAYELLGDPENAFKNYEQALEFDPYGAMAYHWYGLLLAREGDEAKSRELLARYDRLRKLQTIEHDLNMALLRNADDIRALVRLAQVRQELGRTPEALATLKRARALAPNNDDLARLWDQWSRSVTSETPE